MSQDSRPLEKIKGEGLDDAVGNWINESLTRLTQHFWMPG